MADDENKPQTNDRRQGDRRKVQLPFDGPDRRKRGDRRSGGDRRVTPRRSSDQ